MARKPLPETTVTNVLLSSRRRCAICYGLKRDTSIKLGQIAHLDKNNSNNSESNLAFLCLEHHDLFDSSSSQSKGLSVSEVKKFRGELYEAIGRSFSIQVHFGEVTVPNKDPYAGHYVRLGKNEDSAEIELTPIPSNIEGLPRYAVTGEALFGAERFSGPNMGEIEFVSVLEDEELYFSETLSKDLSAPHTIRLQFFEGILKVEDENYFGKYGMGVHFGGVYRRT
ncbi:MAG: hypothetical protein NXI02_03145 [Rhodobacteraceae bacterium]|nr:hypothetical protein [Paracoccaceae bacterium]